MKLLQKPWVSLLLSLLAGASFLVSFYVPFVSSDFHVDLPPKIDRGIEYSVRSSEKLLDQLEGVLGASARRKAEEIGAFWMDRGLERSLGEVGLTPKGEGISWSRCIATGDGASAPGWRPCVKSWIRYKAGIPVGVQTLSAVISRLFVEGEWFLGCLLTLFSVCFPVLKVGLTLSLVFMAGRPQLRQSMKKWLDVSAKWSMTDVFIVALMIVFFKAESFNFHFRAEIGVYLFAAAAVLSSLAIMTLPSAKSTKEPVGEDDIKIS